jgi:hypothetical protein
LMVSFSSAGFGVANVAFLGGMRHLITIQVDG